METKIEAAKICQLAGCSMVIANGLNLNPISMIKEKNNCTWFNSKVSKLDARKKWIISSIAPKGSIIIDDGAKKALKSGNSLLPVGATKCIGQFSRGDVVAVKREDGQIIAKGLASFNQVDTGKILGIKSEDIPSVLGYNRKPELIHRDNMAFFN